MPSLDIKYQSKVLRIGKSAASRDLDSDSVIVSDLWKFVDMWLARNRHSKAQAHWNQASEFARSARDLSTLSQPLPAYYAMLNATKTLLVSRNIAFKELHGVGGERVKNQRSLSAEKITFHSSGVLNALSTYLGEANTKKEYSVKDAIYNLPYVHRAFTTTYRSAKEIFIPVKDVRFVRKKQSTEAWVQAEVAWRYANGHLRKKLPPRWELEKDEYQTIRFKNRFRWNYNNTKSTRNLLRFKKYHSQVRRSIVYINAPQRLWYIKCRADIDGFIARSPLTLTYAVMHRLSELSRYDPIELNRHLNSRHNWLITEFLNTALTQFIDEIAAEITGCDLMEPGIRT